MTKMTAKPDPETTMQVAECSNCRTMVEKTRISRHWYHSYTGEVDCFPHTVTC